MKQHYFLRRLLMAVSGVWFVASATSFLYVSFFLLTGSDGHFLKTKNGIWGSGNIYANGYPITVNATVQIPPDTLVKWNNNNGASGQMSLNKNEYFRYDKADSILSDTSIKKEFHYFTWIAENMLNDEIVKQDLKVSIDKSFSFDTMVNLKSKSLLKNIAFLFSSIIDSFLMLLISYNVFKIATYIRGNNGFLNRLYKRTKYIGVILITGQLIKFALGILYSRWFGIIRVTDEYMRSNLYSNSFHLQFNPKTSASMGAILFGLALIILSSLFKYGNHLENENALTV